MHEGKQSVAVGLFFALGHSTVVILVSLAIATTAASWQRHWAFLAAMGSVGGPLVSATFLLTVALTNASILIPAWRDRAALDNGFCKPRHRSGHIRRRWWPPRQALSPSLPPHDQKLAHVSDRLPLRPRLRHVDRNRADRHCSLANPPASPCRIGNGLPRPVHGRHVADRHRRRHPDAACLPIVLRQNAKQTSLHNGR